MLEAQQLNLNWLLKKKNGAVCHQCAKPLLNLRPDGAQMGESTFVCWVWIHQWITKEQVQF